jgi:hypothetical protein
LRRDDLIDPRVADVATDHDELRKLEQHVVEVRDRTSGLRRAERAGVTDLRAERDPELDAGRVDRVVAAVVRRQVPDPRDDPHRDEAELEHGAAQLSDRGHRAPQVNGCNPGEAVRMGSDDGRDLVVVDQHPAGTRPRAQQRLRDAGVVHRREGVGHGQRGGLGAFGAGPPTERVPPRLR